MVEATRVSWDVFHTRCPSYDPYHANVLSNAHSLAGTFVAPSRSMRTHLLLVLVVGCGGRLADDAVSQTTDAAPDAATTTDGGEASVPLPPNPFSPGQHWRGTYTCAQGLTNLDLQIVSTHADIVDDAVFAFDWSGGVSGAYHLSGAFDPATHRTILTPGAWIDQPQGWYSVGMDGIVDLTTMTYAGNIADPTYSSCGTFTVHAP